MGRRYPAGAGAVVRASTGSRAAPGRRMRSDSGSMVALTGSSPARSPSSLVADTALTVRTQLDLVDHRPPDIAPSHVPTERHPEGEGHGKATPHRSLDHDFEGGGEGVGAGGCVVWPGVAATGPDDGPSRRDGRPAGGDLERWAWMRTEANSRTACSATPKRPIFLRPDLETLEHDNIGPGGQHEKKDLVPVGPPDPHRPVATDDESLERARGRSRNPEFIGQHRGRSTG